METQIKEFLIKLKHPALNEEFISEKSVKKINVHEELIEIDLKLDFYDDKNKDEIKNIITEYVKNTFSKKTKIEIATEIKNHKVQSHSNVLPISDVDRSIYDLGWLYNLLWNRKCGRTFACNWSIFYYCPYIPRCRKEWTLVG